MHILCKAIQSDTLGRCFDSKALVLTLGGMLNKFLVSTFVSIHPAMNKAEICQEAIFILKEFF